MLTIRRRFCSFRCFTYPCALYAVLYRTRYRSAIRKPVGHSADLTALSARISCVAYKSRRSSYSPTYRQRFPRRPSEPERERFRRRICRKARPVGQATLRTVSSFDSPPKNASSPHHPIFAPAILSRRLLISVGNTVIIAGAKLRRIRLAIAN